MNNLICGRAAWSTVVWILIAWNLTGCDPEKKTRRVTTEAEPSKVDQQKPTSQPQQLIPQQAPQQQVPATTAMSAPKGSNSMPAVAPGRRRESKSAGGSPPTLPQAQPHAVT